MKKMFLVCAVVLGAVLCSCNGEGCYKVTMKMGEQTNVVYVYGNSEDVDLAIEKSKQAAALMDVKFSAHRQKVNKSDSDCHN